MGNACVKQTEKQKQRIAPEAPSNSKASPEKAGEPTPSKRELV